MKVLAILTLAFFLTVTIVVTFEEKEDANIGSGVCGIIFALLAVTLSIVTLFN